jgi:hypothetical protein
VVAGAENSRQLPGHQRAERRTDEAERANVGRDIGGQQRTFSVPAGMNNDELDGDDGATWATGAGVEEE